MSDLTVSWIQGLQFWEDKQANFTHLEERIDQLPQSDVILLPEMFHTGFTMNTALADPADQSVALQWLSKQAKALNTAIYTSFILEENGKYYNRGCFMQADGQAHFYDKRKLFAMAGEDACYEAGKKSVIVSLNGWRINLQICYDLRFPEVSRNGLDAEGKPRYDVCLYVANWPDRRSHHWKTLLPARAIENQAYVVGVNRVGKDGQGLEYSGDSVAYNALGEQIGSSAPYEVDMRTVVLSREHLDEVRQRLNFLKDAGI